MMLNITLRLKPGQIGCSQSGWVISKIPLIICYDASTFRNFYEKKAVVFPRSTFGEQWPEIMVTPIVKIYYAYFEGRLFCTTSGSGRC